MSKKKVKKDQPLTPELVIRARLRRLADKEEIFSFFYRLFCMGVALYLILGVLFGITPMKNNDMSPRLSSGDLMLYYRLNQAYHSQDLVVLEKNGRQYVGRIVARGGEEVEVTEEASLRINGSLVSETDIFYSTPRYDEYVTYPLKLNSDEFFVLCDYRDGARDSRYYGPVKKSELKGKVLAVLRRSGL